ncbi:MAG: hypothetical protein WC082_10915 [Victivallales bacterium]
MFEYGFTQEDITPNYGMPLYGYFNLRPNRGALDQLAVKWEECGRLELVE